MYNYSPINKLKVRNFRNIGDVEIDFTQSPIVTLVGENEAGKTSVIKAFATCALHANPRDQKDYIRDETKMFGVEIDLADGTQIVRVKEANGINLYRVIYPDGRVWDTTKLADGLPEEVSKAMGLVAEPETGEFLHIRTYEDKLLFVVTPNSTNYKVMYNALKVEQLTKAIKTGSIESNGLKSQINTNELSMQTLNNQLRAINIIDMTSVLEVRNRLSLQMQMLAKIEQALSLKEKSDKCQEQLGALGLLNRFGVQPISELLSSNLINASRLLNNRNELVNYKNRLNELNNIEEIDTSIISKISSIIDKKSVLDDKIDSAGVLIHVNEINEISEVVALQLSKIPSILNKSKQLNERLDVLDTTSCNEISASDTERINKLNKVHTLFSNIDTKKSEYEQVQNYVVQVQDYLKQCGVAVETCPKCGEAVIFDIDKIEGM